MGEVHGVIVTQYVPLPDLAECGTLGDRGVDGVVALDDDVDGTALHDARVSRHGAGLIYWVRSVHSKTSPRPGKGIRWASVTSSDLLRAEREARLTRPGLARAAPDLLHQAQLVKKAPELGDLAPGNTQECRALHREPLAAGRDTHEVAGVGPLHPQTDRNLVVFPNHVLDRVLDVRKGGTDHRFELVEALQIHGWRPGELGGEAGDAQLHRRPATARRFEKRRARASFAADMSSSCSVPCAQDDGRPGTEVSGRSPGYGLIFS